MGCPTRMGDPPSPRERLVLKNSLEVGDLAGASADFQPAVVQHDDAGRVVAPVFEALQALRQNRHRVLLTDITDNTAHKDFYRIPIKSCIARELVACVTM